MQFDLANKGRRKPSLTPMIDVVFLLLVFFMLASKFGTNTALQMPLAGAGGNYQGPPRLVDIGPSSIALNGVIQQQTQLLEMINNLTDKPTDAIVLRGKTDTTFQRILDVSIELNNAGFRNLVLVE